MHPYWPADPDDLEREYSPSSRVGGSSAPFVADYEARSAIASATLGRRLEVLGGGHRVVAAAAGAPLLVFVHGGYWQALSAAASTYLAPGALALGWSYAALEYTLAPEADVGTMVDECRGGLAEVVARVRRLVGDVGPVVVAGHSAGAHLAALMAVAAEPPVAVRRVVLVSGVFDLRPLVATTVNDTLGLDAPGAGSLSPMLLPVVPPCPDGATEVVVTWGDDDTEAFAAQSRAYADVLRAAGSPVVELECAGRHHFDIVDDLVDPHTALGAAVVRG
ncbi:MAG: alpha/beta hydrolase [Ilumatobacteraceae bacterium]